MNRTFKPTPIVAHLVEVEHADDEAAQVAGRAIAEAWNDREFWWSATATPLAKCALDSPAMTDDVPAVLDRLIRHCGTYVHNIAEWEPAP
ncbi:hypothetical protein [Prauserella cavernicola]|uniref:Uncharacterized protein n=1 Tax=Prauserella cavernicola TaxID=2800127 RepID=A0A934V4B9_9PSEU|nr:hypothetical protein [Prauserella cavernicola]MBK1784554.1 hypothetical protein [Prauserella cavernicola]